MDLQELSNFFTLTAEILIGILAVQGIATTFIFSKKSEWTYVDKWEFFWVIFNNVTGTIVCVFSIFLLITIKDVQVFLENVFNFIFLMLSITTFLFLYTEKRRNSDL